MSDFSARKPIVTADPDAKSKKLDETLEKLSSIRAERRDLSAEADMPSLSAKKPGNTNNEYSIQKGSSLTKLRVTSVANEETPTKSISGNQPTIEIKKSKSTEKPVIAKEASKPEIKTDEKTPEQSKEKIEAKAETPKGIVEARKKPEDRLSDLDMRATKKSYDHHADIGSHLDEMFDGDADNEPVLMLSPKNSVPMKRTKKYKITSFLGIILTIGWLGLTAFYIQNNMGFAELFSQQPHILGGFLAGILAPVALLWMILAFMQRGSDIHMYADALRGELQAMIFPSEERKQVIHEDIEALCKQAAELSASSKTVLNSIHRARVGLRNEIRDFSGLSKKTEFHIDRLADSLGDRSKKLIELTDEIENRTTSLDAKTISGAKAWDDAATSILARAGDIEEAMRKGAQQIVEAANEAETTTGSINTKLADSFETLRASVDSVKTMTSSTVRAITEASQTIEDNRDSLGDGAKLLSEKASEITDKLNGSVTAIQDSIEAIVSKSDGIHTNG